MEDKIIFTEAALLELLSQIDELKEYDVEMRTDNEGSIDILIGDSTYTVKMPNIEEVEVSEDVIEVVEDVNDDTFDAIDNDFEDTYLDYEDEHEADDRDIDDLEDIEGGLIKEGVKSLLLGGAIRFAAKHGGALLR